MPSATPLPMYPVGMASTARWGLKPEQLIMAGWAIALVGMASTARLGLKRP